MKREKYDFAISFAGEDRDIAENLVSLIKATGCTVFYDDFERSRLLGKDLYQELSAIYMDRARFCLVLISAAYLKKLWTRHELRSAQAGAFGKDDEYILPLRLDDTDVPGILPTTGYIDLRRLPLEEVALILLEKTELCSSAHSVVRQLNDIFPNSDDREAFVEYCESLETLAEGSRWLCVTYVAIGGAEDLFFTAPALRWFSVQRKFVASGALNVERLVFFDVRKYKMDAVYRLKINRIRNAVEFTSPFLAIVAIDPAKSGVPQDLQIFDASGSEATMIIPFHVARGTMRAAPRWRTFKRSGPPEEEACVVRAMQIFEEYKLLARGGLVAHNTPPEEIAPITIPDTYLELKYDGKGV